LKRLFDWKHRQQHLKDAAPLIVTEQDIDGMIDTLDSVFSRISDLIDILLKA